MEEGHEYRKASETEEREGSLENNKIDLFKVKSSK